MINLKSVKKMYPDYFPVKNTAKKKRNKWQPVSKATMAKMIAVLSYDKWVTFVDVSKATGLTSGTISRGARCLTKEKIAKKKVDTGSRSNSSWLKLTA